MKVKLSETNLFRSSSCANKLHGPNCLILSHPASNSRIPSSLLLSSYSIYSSGGLRWKHWWPSFQMSISKPLLSLCHPSLAYGLLSSPISLIPATFNLTQTGSVYQHPSSGIPPGHCRLHSSWLSLSLALLTLDPGCAPHFGCHSPTLHSALSDAGT